MNISIEMTLPSSDQEVNLISESYESDYQPIDQQTYKQLEQSEDSQTIDPSTVNPDTAPKDTANIVFFMAIIVGLATFFPSTAVLASNDYYQSVWGETGKNLVFFAPLLIQVTTPGIQTLLLKYQERLTYTSRIEFAFILNTCVAIFFPIQVQIFPSWLSFIIACASIMAIGIANSILKVSEISLFSLYPAKYMQVLLIGQGCSPLAVLALKFFLKAFYTPHGPNVTPEEKANSAAFVALIFFIISATATAIAGLFFKFARRSIFSRHYFPSFKLRYQKYLDARTKYAEYKEMMRKQEEQSKINNTTNNSTINGAQEYAISTDGEIEPQNSELLTQIDHCEQQIVEMPTKVRKLEVFAKVKYFMFLLFLSTIPPCAVYPSLLNIMKPAYGGTFNIDEAWNHLIMMAVYTIVDILGRATPLPLISKIPVNRIEIFIAIRYVIYAALVVATYLNMSSYIHIILTSLTAFTQALVLVRVLTSFKIVCQLSPEESNVAGSISAICIATGVLTGYLLALLIDKL